MGKNLLTLAELASASNLSERSLRRYVRFHAMPCEQQGRAPDGPGEFPTPYLFDGPATLEWIANFRAERERNAASPYTPILDPLDPRFDAAVAATRRIEIQIQEISSTYTRRDMTLFAFKTWGIVQHEIFARAPGRIARAIDAIGNDDLDGKKISKRVADLIEEALENYSYGNFVAALPPEMSAPTMPDELDELDADEGDSDSEGLELARRYHKSDPRYRLTKLRTELVALKNMIATGTIIEQQLARGEYDLALNIVKSSLSGIASRIVQPLTSDPILFRRLVGIINQGIYAAYNDCNSPDADGFAAAMMRGADPLDVDFEPDPLDEPELDRLPKPEPELELDEI